MPDHIEPIATVDGQADWPAMLHDLEKRVETMSDALDGVRLSMRRLVLAEPGLEDALSNGATATPAIPAEPATPIQTPAPVESPLPSGVLPPAVYEAVSTLEPEAAPPAYVPQEYDADAREAVRQAVQDAKSEKLDWRDIPVSYVTEDKPEVSRVTLPNDDVASELPAVQAEVGLDDGEAARDAVRRAVEEAKAEMAFGADAPSATAIDDEEMEHGTVRRAVDETMLNASYEDTDAPSATSENDDSAAREAVRRAVEESKVSLGYVPADAEPPAAPADEEAQREAVRQAVAQARAEMAGSGSLTAMFDPQKPVEVAPAYVVPPPHRPERVHPPTITIEDPEGRVELARVYNLLKRLDCAANSSLLNYSSRQVSVQLSDKSKAPDDQQMGDAVREVFERANEVRVDGLNVIVKLGVDQIKAA